MMTIQEKDRSVASLKDYGSTPARASNQRRGRNGNSISVLGTERRHSSLAGNPTFQTALKPSKKDDSLIQFLELKIDSMELQLTKAKQENFDL